MPQQQVHQQQRLAMPPHAALHTSAFAGAAVPPVPSSRGSIAPAASVAHRRRDQQPWKEQQRFLQQHITCSSIGASNGSCSNRRRSSRSHPLHSSPLLFLLLLPALLFSLAPCFFALAQPAGAAQSVLLDSDELRWVSLSASARARTGATCNDGSVPGFYASLATASPSDPLRSLSGLTLAEAATVSSAPVSWSTKWVIYLEGGGACLDKYSCELRAQDYPDHVTSALDPPSIQAANLLLANRSENAVSYDHHRIYVKYCSSDFFIGRQPARSLSSLPANTTHSPYAFMGASIVAALIEDLLAAGAAGGWLGATEGFPAPSLANATEIIIGGSSAGAIGAVNHADGLRAAVWDAQAAAGIPSAHQAQVRLLLDSGWFVDFRNQVGLLSHLAAEAWNMQGSDFLSGNTSDTTGSVVPWVNRAPECARPEYNVLEVAGTVGVMADGNTTSGVLCCFLSSCMTSSFLSPYVHVLVVQSLYDSFLLALGHSAILGDLVPSLVPETDRLEDISLSNITPDVIEDGLALVQVVNSYGGAYNQSFLLQRRQALQALASAAGPVPNMHFVLLSCFEHVYLPHKSTDSVEGVTPIFNHVSSDSWSSVLVGRPVRAGGGTGPVVGREEKILRDIITLWVNSTSAAATASGMAPLHFMDYCPQAQCNPTCPDFVSFEPSSLADRMSNTRIFETSSQFGFILEILCVVWLFFPSLCQLAVWAWSLLTRQRAQMALQMVLLSSPLTMVQRGRPRRGGGPGAGRGGGGGPSIGGGMQRMPSMISMKGGTTSGDEDDPEEEAAAATRNQPVHFSFLGLHYWPAIIEGPRKKTGSAAALAVSPPWPEPRRPRTTQSRSKRHTAKVGSFPAVVSVLPVANGFAQPDGASGAGPGDGITGVASQRPSVVVVVDDREGIGAEPGPSPSSSPRAKGAPSVTDPGNGTATATATVNGRKTNNSSGSGLRSSENGAMADNHHVINVDDGAKVGQLDHLRFSLLDGTAQAVAFTTALEAVAAGERAAAAAAAGTGALAAPAPKRHSNNEVQMVNLLPDGGAAPALAASPPPSNSPPPLNRVRSILRQKSLAVAVPPAAGTPTAWADKDKEKEKSVVTASSPGGPGLQRTRTRRMGPSNPSVAGLANGLNASSGQYAGIESIRVPAPEAPQTLPQLEEESGLPAEAALALSQPLLKGVNGRFSSGQLIALMGKSGCGKSTLLELLACRRTFGMTSGGMFINGVPLESCMGWMKASVGFVSQYGSAAIANLSVLDNLLYAARLRLPLRWKESKRLARVQAVIDMCGLGPMKHTLVGSNEGDKGGLSGGQRRRVALAIELLSAPRLLMLDEITSGLDASSALELLLVLHSIVESTNMCCVLSIHQPRVESWGLFHQVLVLDAGHVIFQGAPFAALHEFTQGIVESAQWGLPKRDSEKLLRVSQAALDGNKTKGKGGEAEANAAANVNVADFVLDCLKYPAIGRAMQRRYERCYRGEIIDLIEHGIAETAEAEKFEQQQQQQQQTKAVAALPAPSPLTHRQRQRSTAEGLNVHRARSIGNIDGFPGLHHHRQRSQFASSQMTEGGGGPPQLHRQRSMMNTNGEPGLQRTRTHRRGATEVAPPAPPKPFRPTVTPMSRWAYMRQSVANVATLEARRLHSMSKTPIALLKMPVFFIGLGTVFAALFFMKITSALDTTTWFVLLTNIANHMACTPLTFTLFDSMALYQKEMLAGAVTPLQHMMALVLHMSTIAILASNMGWFGGILISSPSALADIQWGEIGTQMLLECLCMRCFTNFYQFLVFSGYPRLNLEAATMLAAFAVSFCFVFSGFLIAPRLVPAGLKFILYINPMYWAFGAMVKLRLQELIRLDTAAKAVVGASNGSSCAEGVSGWQCLLFQIPSFDTGDTSTTTRLVLDTYDLASIDVHSSMLILLLMAVSGAFISWFCLKAPWKLTQPVECTLHADQIALAANYREQQVEREFTMRQAQLRTREAELARVKQQTMEEVSVHALASIKGPLTMHGSVDMSSLFAQRGAARWAAITRQRLFRGGATLLLEMDAGADQLAADLSDPALMERYARARAQAAVQQREMNEWNRVMQEEARAEAEAAASRQHGNVMRAETPVTSDDDTVALGATANSIAAMASRSGTPRQVLRHRRGDSTYNNMSSYGRPSSTAAGDNIVSTPGGDNKGTASPFPTSQVTPAFMRLAPGVGAALGFAPAVTPDSNTPNMALLVRQLVQQQRKIKRASMEMGGADSFAAALAAAGLKKDAAPAGGSVAALSGSATFDPTSLLASPAASANASPLRDADAAAAAAADAASSMPRASLGEPSIASLSPAPSLQLQELYVPTSDGGVQPILHSPSTVARQLDLSATATSPMAITMFMPNSDGDAQPLMEGDEEQQQQASDEYSPSNNANAAASPRSEARPSQKP